MAAPRHRQTDLHPSGRQTDLSLPGWRGRCLTGCLTRRAGPRRAVLPSSALRSPSLLVGRLLLASVGAPALPRHCRGGPRITRPWLSSPPPTPTHRRRRKCPQGSQWLSTCPLPPARCHPAGRWGCIRSTTCPTTTIARLRRLSGTLRLPFLHPRLVHQPMRSHRPLSPLCTPHILRTSPYQPPLCRMANSSPLTLTSLRTPTANHHTPTSCLPTPTSSHSTPTRTHTSSLLTRTRTDRHPTEPSHQATRQHRSTTYLMAEGRPTHTVVRSPSRSRSGPSPRRTRAARAPRRRGRRCFP
jgi:hypothetical protein